MIAYESGGAEVADPFAGSYAIEALTGALEERTRAYLGQIEALGGMIGAISHGFVQREIQESAYQYQRAVENEESTIVGVNAFVSEARPPIKMQRISSKIEREQCQRLQQVKASRDSKKVESALDLIEEVSQGQGILVPVMIKAVECGATLWEISDRLRRVFGEHQENTEI